jgi:hypothetical protein
VKVCWAAGPGQWHAAAVPARGLNQAVVASQVNKGIRPEELAVGRPDPYVGHSRSHQRSPYMPAVA